MNFQEITEKERRKIYYSNKNNELRTCYHFLVNQAKGRNGGKYKNFLFKTLSGFKGGFVLM
jgi:hypothetical protein